MSDIRKGDTIIDARGYEWWVEESGDGATVSAVSAASGGSRTFAVRSLECIDRDDGVWAAMAPASTEP